jgi:hypothetical protein
MENTTKKRTQRTPAELIAEHEAKLERLRMKQLKADAANDPELAPLVEELGEIKKSIIAAKKILGSGPQSAEARRAKHYAWIEKIDQEERNAQYILDEQNAIKEDIETKLNKAIEAKA